MKYASFLLLILVAAGPTTQPGSRSPDYLQGLSDAGGQIAKPPPPTQLTTSFPFVKLPTVPPPPAYPFPLTTGVDDGWMIVPVAPGAKQIYVASSGSDTNPGTQTQPLKTIAAAMKLTKPANADCIYLNCGDTFPETVAGNLSGNGTNYAHLQSYGDPAKGRPVVGGQTMAGKSLLLLYGDNLYVSDIKWDGGRDPSLPGFKLVATGGGVQFRGKNLIFEGNESCWNCGSNLDVEPRPDVTLPLTGVFIRRNVFHDAYSGGASLSQGMHTDGLDSPLVEENVFFRNGWTPKVSLGTNAMFNHNYYCSWNVGSKNAYIRWNTFIYGASSALQQRCGGVCHNNLFIANGTAEDLLVIGNNAFVDMNVFTVNVDVPATIGPNSTTFYTGGGIQFNAEKGSIFNNILCHTNKTQGFGTVQISRTNGSHNDPKQAGLIEIAGNVTYDTYWDAFDYAAAEHPDVYIHDNVTVQARRKQTNMRPDPLPPATQPVGKIRMTNNVYDLDGQFWWYNVGMNLAGWKTKVNSVNERIGPTTFVDPSRTIEKFLASQNISTFNNYVALLLAQRKGHYDKHLVSYTVNSYFQEGFAK